MPRQSRPGNRTAARYPTFQGHCNFGVTISRRNYRLTADHLVDTNILMYAHDASAGPKHELAKALVQELWRDRTGIVSTQVLQELCVNLRRKAGKPLDKKATREIVIDYLSWQVVVNGGEAVLDALDLEERHHVSFCDAMVIHSAQVAGAEVLYSEDLSHGQEYGFSAG